MGYQCKNRRKYSLKAHIILVTKYRKRLLTSEIENSVKTLCINLSEQNGWEIIAMETDEDHIHLLLGYDTTERVCDIVGRLKQYTTYHLWSRHGSILSKYYWRRHVLWSDGYFACSVGDVSTTTVQNYIESQG